MGPPPRAPATARWPRARRRARRPALMLLFLGIAVVAIGGVGGVRAAPAAPPKQPPSPSGANCAKITGVRGCNACSPPPARPANAPPPAPRPPCSGCDPTQGYVLNAERGRCDALPGYGSAVDTALVEAAASDSSLPESRRAQAKALLQKYQREFGAAFSAEGATGGPAPAVRRCPDADGFASYVRGPGPARPRFAVCTPCPMGLAADAARAACVRDPARGPAPVADAPLPPLPPPAPRPGAAAPAAPAPPPAVPQGAAFASPGAPGSPSSLVQAPPSAVVMLPPLNGAAKPGANALPGAIPFPGALPPPPPPGTKAPPGPLCFEAFYRPTPAVACNYREPLPGTARCANATATGCSIATCCTLTCGRDFHDSLALNAEADQAGAQRKRRARCGPSAGHPAPDSRVCPASGCTVEKCCEKADVRCWAAFDKAGGGERFCPAARRPKPGDTRCAPGNANPDVACTADACCDKAPTCEQWFKVQARPAFPCDVYLPKDKGTVCPGQSGLCDRSSCCDLSLQQCSLVKQSWWRPGFACPSGSYLDTAARCREPCADAALKTSCCRQGKAPPAAPTAPAPPAIPQGSFFG